MAPYVLSIVRSGGSAQLTKSSLIEFTITFNESVYGVDATDFTAWTEGPIPGNISITSGSDGSSVYTVALEANGNGEIRINLKSYETEIKNISNENIASGFKNGEFYTLDQEPPDTLITSNPSNYTSSTSASFLASSEDGAKFEWSLDGGAYENKVGIWTLSSLTDGNHTVQVRSIDLAGNVDPTPGSYTWTVDTQAPFITGVTASNPNGIYKVGDVIALKVNFNEIVAVTGVPQLLLKIGNTERLINYFSGNNTSALTFNYSVQAGDISADLDYASSAAFTLNGGSIVDRAGNPATAITLPNPGGSGSLGSNKDIVIDGIVPSITSVTVPTGSTYLLGQQLDFTVNFTEAIYVTGTPRIAIALDTGGTVYANYTSGTGSNALIFRMTVAPDEYDDSGITLINLTANSGSLRDVAGNNAALTLNNVSNTSSVWVNGTQPKITSITSSTLNGSYKAGSVISVEINFSENVTVTGVPQLK